MQESDGCVFPGCELKGNQSAPLDRKLYCDGHRGVMLKRMANDFLETLSPGNIPPPNESPPMAYFLRWVEDSIGFAGGLTRAKVRDRTTDWTFDGTCLQFTIERHPAGLVTRDRWAFNIHSNTWDELESEIVGGIVALTKKGEPKCPNCGCSMHRTVGRLRCNNHICRNEITHEHTRE